MTKETNKDKVAFKQDTMEPEVVIKKRVKKEQSASEESEIPETYAEFLDQQWSSKRDLLLKYEYPLPILDDGFVKLLDVMGSDRTIAMTARTSYGVGTKKLREDRNLIRYLMRNMHTSPIEQAVIQFHLRIPIYVLRQLDRHRTARKVLLYGSMNEYSQRYSHAIDAMELTEPGHWRLQSTTNKQGSNGFAPIEQGASWSEREEFLQKESRKLYDEMIAAGVAREQARKVIPTAGYTELIWRIDLHNLLHLLALREDHHAQYEIRVLAHALAEITRAWVPCVMEAFEDYHPLRNGRQFSRQEMLVLKRFIGDLLCDDPDVDLDELENLIGTEIAEFQDDLAAYLKNEHQLELGPREWAEFQAKFKTTYYAEDALPGE